MARHRYYDDYGAFPQYVPVGEKQSRNRKAVTKLRKKGTDIRPVVVEGRSIAQSWWGKSWNRNLERYADYSNRIGRGRSYVRHGAVLDLQISAGTVKALVQGSRGSPYEIVVTIDRLGDDVWTRLRGSAVAQLDSLTDLLAGKFPKALKESFFAQDTGLFPAPAAISFDCSCPDWASMCKHVAAVLYGIGNRLDETPELLFTLRQVTVDELIEKTVEATAGNLIDRAETVEGDDVLDGIDLAGTFGIELETGDVPTVDLPAVDPAPLAETRPTRQKPSRAPRGRKRSSAAVAASGAREKSGPRQRQRKVKPKPKPRQRQRKAKESRPERGHMVEQLVVALGTSRRGRDTIEIWEKLPGWTRLQVSNTLQRAAREGRVERVERGVFRRT